MMPKGQTSMRHTGYPAVPTWNVPPWHNSLSLYPTCVQVRQYPPSIFFLRRNFGNLCIQHSYTIIDMRNFGRQRFEPVQRLQLRFLRLIYLTVGTLDILQCGRLLFFKDCTFLNFEQAIAPHKKARQKEKTGVSSPQYSFYPCLQIGSFVL